MVDPRDLRTPEQVLADAEAFGVDLSLIAAQLRRTPAERLRLLSDNLEFYRTADRARARQLRVTEPSP